uniref:Uncharacterized protein n=1 Tax=Setaria viridis TaxID=4556 RepID=A0A4U6UVA6_SETVI|nr:hypothetical protein SEVIR_4G037301v2 [Setaria viridis]
MVKKDRVMLEVVGSNPTHHGRVYLREKTHAL